MVCDWKQPRPSEILGFLLSNTKQPMNIPEVVDQITNERINRIRESSECFKQRMEEWKTSDNPYFKERMDDVLLFVEKYLQWRKERAIAFYAMFYDAMWSENYNIFDPLLHFIGYHVFDDGDFKIVWHRRVYGKDIVESTEDDENSYPVLVTCCDGFQDVKIIIEAMDKYEQKTMPVI